MQCGYFGLCDIIFFFFFKQKTAYEMRISDWSSDVCSSDLMQCEQALEAARWPEGFRCPRCAGTVHCVLRDGTRKVFQCSACRHQASLIAGTLLQGTKLPLTPWFLAISLISKAKTGLSAPIGRASCRQRVGQYVSVWG